MVIYSRFLLGTAAITLTPRLIIIKSRYRDDAPLLAHELCHQAQMRFYGTAEFWLRYLFNRAFRQAMEVEAYKIQIAKGANPDSCAYNLATHYRLNISVLTAYRLLTTN